MVEFYYEEMAGDLESLSSLAGDFLHAGTKGRTGRVASAAADIRRRVKSDSAEWRVEEEDGFLTRVSKGESEWGRQSNWTLLGHVSFVWHIRKTKRGKPTQARFAVSNASTRIKVFHCSEDAKIIDHVPLAEWRFEIGGSAHPGCVMHTQMEWQNRAMGEKRKLAIPRLPTIILTPSECLDFLLGELFQESWHSAVRHGEESKRWKSNHRGRLDKLLRAQLALLNDPVGSPWHAIKEWKAAGLILRG